MRGISLFCLQRRPYRGATAATMSLALLAAGRRRAVRQLLA